MNLKKFDKLKVPTHVAFIMDGNRRWAKSRGLDKTLGHRQGAIALTKIISVLRQIKGVKYASFFGFSTENWNREQREIDYIFDLAYQTIVDNENKLKDNNIKLVLMGDSARFPEKLRLKILDIVEKTKDNTGLIVYMGLNYGGRDDIVSSVKKLVEKGEEISEQSIKENLYCPHDVDLLVRTSGELRVSNFMLYQMAYSEFYFPNVHWPAFNDKQLFKAFKAYSKRNRRFGGK